MDQHTTSILTTIKVIVRLDVDKLNTCTAGGPILSSFPDTRSDLGYLLRINGAPIEPSAFGQVDQGESS